MGKYFTEKERYQLEAYYNKMHLKPKEIAKIMCKHPNTIYNELHRGFVEQVNTHLKSKRFYCADTAQRKADYNATAKGAKLKISNDFAFAEYIEKLVCKKKYSLYSALMSARKQNFKTTVCLRTLYNYVEHHVFLELDYSKMPVGRLKRKKYHYPKRIYQFGKKNIDERDFCVLERSSFGHWEMDSVVGKRGSKNTLLVLTERKTRYELIYRLPNKQCASVWKQMEKICSRLGKKFNQFFKTITCDNGVEFSTNYPFKNKRLKKFIQTNLFYCHPYCSSERGSNEVQNKLIRRFIPKGTDISSYTDDYISYIQQWVNNIPRKIFSGLSSAEMVKKEFEK